MVVCEKERYHSRLVLKIGVWMNWNVTEAGIVHLESVGN